MHKYVIPANLRTIQKSSAAEATLPFLTPSREGAMLGKGN